MWTDNLTSLSGFGSGHTKLIATATEHPCITATYPERRLKAEKVGGVRFDAFTRGRYSTDASHYQIMPLGVATPRTIEEAERAIAVCRAEGVAVTARGGGTSQAGQTVNESLDRRLLAASQPHRRARCRQPALRRSSRASCSTSSIAS